MSDGDIIVDVTTIEAETIVVDVILPPAMVEAIDVTAPPPAVVTVEIAEIGPPGPQGEPGPPGPAGGIPEAPTDGATYGRSGSSGGVWRALVNITVSATPPAAPGVNDVWIDIS